MQRPVAIADLSDLLSLKQSIRDAQIQQFEPRIRMINKYRHLFTPWPNASACDMLVSLEDCNYDPDTLAEQLLVDSFRERVLMKVDLKKRRAAGNDMVPSDRELFSEEEEAAEDEEEAEDSSPKKREKNEKGETRRVRSHLDDRPSDISEQEWRSWSPIRRHRWLNRETQDAYYFHHLAPGERPRRGRWSPAEQARFFRRVDEFRQLGLFPGHWGLFAQAIRGRCGYDCNNFYSSLRRRHDPRVLNTSGVEKVQSIEFFTIAGDPIMRLPVRYRSLAMLNPVPDMLDPMSGEKMILPMISPDGFVLDQASWRRLKVCPFTQKPILRRSLEHLTIDNFEKWKDRIRKFDEE